MSADLEPHSAGSERRRGFVALSALISADSISQFGSVMTLTAIPWFVLVTTGSVSRTGVTVFASGVALVIALLFGGTVVDRVGWRRASIMGDLTAGCLVAAIPAAYDTVGLPFWLLVALVSLATLFDIPSRVGRYSALPDLADGANVRFERANAIFDSTLTGAGLIGPAVAGVLIAVVGTSNVIWIDAATFGASAILMTSLVPRSVRRTSSVSTRSGLMSQLGEAIRFVVRDDVLGPLVLVLGLMNVAIGSMEQIVIPVMSRDVYHSAYVLGLLTSAMALGGLGGNVVYGIIGHRMSRRGGFGLGFLTVPVALAVLALQPVVGVSLVMLAIVGLGLSLTNLLEYTVYFERLPHDMRARGLGITGALTWGSAPLGRIACGFGIAALGIAATLTGASLLILPVPLALLALPRFSRLNVTPVDESTT